MSRVWKKAFFKKAAVLSLAAALLIPAGTVSLPLQAAAEDVAAVTFQRDVTNKPVFDGVPGHLKAFVELVLADMSNDDLIYYTDQKSAGNARTIAGGYELPGTAAGGVDRVMGVSTDMPSMLALGQSWNKELVNEVGTVIGNERRGEVASTNPNTLMFSAVSDLRTNPLSGRFEEGYAEDPVLAGSMVSAMSEGITGYGEAGNEDGFWLKVQLGTKHFTNYIAQWFRQSGQFSASARALNEYQNKSFLAPLEAGLVQSIMTTYGRTNGVPNHISPNIIRASNANPYSMMPVGDFIFADQNMTNGFNNGYQNYTDADGKAALLLLSGNHANANGSTQANLKNAIANGTFGVTRTDLENGVRGQIEMWVRTGYFNAKNADGTPVLYPFTQLAKDKSPQDSTLTDSQAVALEAARESVVLLKNDNGLLPLAGSSDVAVTGLFADTRFKATYSVSKTPALPDAGLSPLGAIREAAGAEHVTYGTGAPIVAFESVANGKTVTAATYAAGAQLTASFTAPASVTAATYTAASPVTEDAVTVTENVYTYQAGGKFYTDAQAFEAYAWGQGGYSFLSLANGKWMKDVTSGSSRTVQNNDATKLNLVENPFSNVADASTLPGRFRHEVNADGTVSLIAGTYTESFAGGFETVYYTGGRFVTLGATEGLELSAAPLANKAGAAARTDSQKYREVVLKKAGADAQVWAADNDYAVVVVGTPARHSAGEGADRSDLNLGEDQYKIVSEVAKSFPKKTIVIVKANAPVNMKEIQNNENVAAILYQPYAGQYDSKALAEVLYGDYAPTGRLTSTWYAGTESFPALSRYSLPEGVAAPTTLAEIDPRFTADMTNGDPLDSKMTYMYTDAEVTYPFGYGLGYSSFSYSNLKVPAGVSGDQPFTVSVDVTNTGTVDTSEVVQLYIKHNASSYGGHTPKKQLVSYAKADIAAGATRTVRLTVKPSDFAVWDVNRNEYVTEAGSYTLMAGTSSDAVLLDTVFAYSGEGIAVLAATEAPVNVFDHSFASRDVVYREVSKLRTADGLKAKLSENGYYAVMSKNSNAWTALNKVDLTGVNGITLRGASVNASSVIEVRADSPNGTRLAVLTFDQTKAATRDVPGSTFKVIELDYTEVTESFLTSTSGIHDLYLVFKNPDIRVDSIQLHGTAPEPEPAYPGGTGSVQTPVTQNPAAGSTGTEETGSTPPSPVPAQSLFKDVGDNFSWAAEAINKLAAAGIIKGTAADTFEPGKPITRADVVLLLVRAFSLQGGTAAASFTDVKPDAYYAEALATAKSLGITEGDGGRFNPQGQISRQDLFVLIMRTLKSTGKLDVTGTAADLAGYRDAAQVSGYAAEAVATLVKAGLVKGDGTGLNPRGTATRAEAATILYRIMNSL
ncbi:glycoside hydrolase family 3 C-terminal domain-containing protein [Paenibacillus sp. FSL R7-0345]|uniref:glycoside hydrolase family 3 C-terminal domain-containing protein n=1 Tax=Paenibacillus sp. FSL R7-0345 TaxID=2954535 RepID=UPI00315AFD0A